jgi:hypothetical protein
MGGDPCAGLRGYSAVGWDDGLIRVAKRQGNHDVELKLAGAYKAAEITLEL